MIIYIVKGSTGDYEDSYQWIAKAYSDKEKAETYYKKLNDIAQKSHAGNFGKTYGERDHSLMYQEQEKVAEELSVLDPKSAVRGPGTSYKIEELEVDTE